MSKYCEKCGQEITDGSSFCPNCGANGYVPQNVQANYAAPIKKQTIDTVIPIVCFAIAGLVLILSLIACFQMMGGAGELASMRSQSGTSLAEAFYNEVGTVYGGLALFVMAFGLFASGLLTFVGFKSLKKVVG